jgi:hypothetical protein
MKELLVQLLADGGFHGGVHDLDIAPFPDAR